MASLEEKLYACLEDEILEICEKELRRTPFSGAVSLCAGESGLFCADNRGALWRLDRHTMMELSVGCGGPGVCGMCLSDDGERLFSLLGEADSILMSDASACAPLAVNRCGCNPQNMSHCAQMIAVSGGESCCVHLFSMQTLECTARIPMPGPVFSVLLARRTLYALCLTAEMSSLFVTCQGREKRIIRLEGMPGCMSALGENVLIATQGRQYLYSPSEGCLLGVSGVPGRARRLCIGCRHVYLLDDLSETVFVLENGLPWRRLFEGAKDMFCCRFTVQ